MPWSPFRWDSDVRAASSPERATRSTRSAAFVFFAVVGGVPNKLLHFTASDPERSRIRNADWNAILGRDPANFNYDGIDPHMIASVSPRPGVAPPSDTRGDNGNPSDPMGRDWKTGDDDLQYACTFDLPVPRGDDPRPDARIADPVSGASERGPQCDRRCNSFCTAPAIVAPSERSRAAWPSFPNLASTTSKMISFGNALVSKVVRHAPF